MSPALQPERPPRSAAPRRNSALYRLAHWPLWIAALFPLPGTWIVQLFANGPDPAIAFWMALVTAGTGIAAFRGRLPGCEPFVYVDARRSGQSNPLYRRICYTAVWIDLLAYGGINLAGLLDAALFGTWHLQILYRAAFFPVAAVVALAGAAGLLPFAKRTTNSEVSDRRWLYSAIWSACVAQPMLGILSQLLPQTRAGIAAECAVFVSLASGTFLAAIRGWLPRTRA